jgi:hypothetical protein
MRVSYDDLQDPDTSLNLDRYNTARLLNEHHCDFLSLEEELGVHDRYNSADILAFLGY